MARPFSRHGESVAVRFNPNEIALMRDLTTDLVTRLGDVGDAEPVADPTLRRLFPDGYNDDPAAAAELRSLIQDDLRDGKIASARTVLETLSELPPSGRLVLDQAQANCFLGTLNDVRLAWGTALDVTEDIDLARQTGDEAADFALGLYAYLGWLQECLIDSLTG